MTARDPVADVLSMVTTQAHAAGVRDGQRRSARWAFVRGIVVGALAMLLLIGWAVAAVPPAAEQYRRDLVRAAHSAWGLDAPIATLAAQVHAESAWRPRAVSWAGARGLAQFMPSTAAGLARQYTELRPANAFDPRWSLRAQATLMRDLRRQSEPAAGECHLHALAAASYNQGPAWTRRQRDASPTPLRWFGATEAINPGKRHAAWVETHGYVRRILIDLEPVYVAAAWGRGVCGGSVARGG